MLDPFLPPWGGTREAGKDHLDSLGGTREAPGSGAREAGKDHLDSLGGTREAPGAVKGNLALRDERSSAQASQPTGGQAVTAQLIVMSV